MAEEYLELVSELDEALELFLEEVNKKTMDEMATDEWTVKDVLGHITFWHQYYAQQYEGLAMNTKPYMHPSLAGKNEEGQKSMKAISKRALVAMLNEANTSLKRCILVNKVPRMQYMKSRAYTTSDFLKVVVGHIKRHTLQVRRAKPGDLLSK